MPSPVIDFHAHAFPENFKMPQPLADARKSARMWIRPLTSSLHRAQTLFRHLPGPIREGVDQLAGVVPIAGLIVESTIKDLVESMEDCEIDQAVLIAHPPFVPNEFVLASARKDPCLIAAVNIDKSVAKPAAQLRSYVDLGAKVLKIHAAADGESPDSKRYRALLKVARELELPVIIHTGCIHTNLFFRNANYGKAELFAPWFSEFPEIQFILAHMNWHEPTVALDLAEEHANIFVDTSWQPAETIGEAVRRIGAERVLFGSDWPLLGNNLSVGLQRIEDCVETGMISEADSSLILGKNAARILKMGET